eukprot:gene9725-11431_t
MLSFIVPLFWHIEEVSRASAIRTEQCTDPLTTDMLLFGLEDRFGRCLLLSLVVITLIALTRCTIPRHPVTATIPVTTTATATAMAAATTSRATAVVATPVTVQMVRQDRDGVYESLPQDEQNMV